MSRPALLVCSLLFASVSWAQVWKPGFVVRSGGERRAGLIADEGWERSPLTVEYKANAGAAVQRFSPETIEAFGIDGGEQYSVLAVQYDPDLQSDRNSTVLPKSREPVEVKQGTFFMQGLIRGEISLYLWIDPNGRRHFFLQVANAIPEELMYRRYSSTDDKNEDVVRINVRYRQQLQLAVSSCDSGEGNIEKLEYSEKALQRWVSAFNICKGNGNTYQFTPPKSPTYFGVLGEVFLYQAKIGYPQTPWGPPHIGAGLSYEIVSPKRNGLYSMLFEGKFRLLEQDGEDTYYDEDAIFKVNDFRVVFMPRFNYPMGEKRQWFWNLGVAFSFDFNSIITYTDGQQIYANTYNGIDYGFAMGLGAYLVNTPKSALGLEFRYEQGDGFLNVFNFDNGIQSFALNATYKVKGGSK